MKNSILFLALILICFGVKAVAGEKTISYVKTSNEVYFGQDLKMGLFNTRIITEDGTVTKIPNRDVTAYMHNSKLFEYLPVVCEENDTTCYAMMEYMTTKSGLNLYRHSSYESKDTRYVFYVYKDGKFHLRIDQKNAPTVLPFFGIKVV
jgi:hypothetical protein